MSLTPKAQAMIALQNELDRREELRQKRSLELWGHAGASIPKYQMSRIDQWDFLLEAYDKARLTETIQAIFGPGEPL